MRRASRPPLHKRPVTRSLPRRRQPKCHPASARLRPGLRRRSLRGGGVCVPRRTERKLIERRPPVHLSGEAGITAAIALSCDDPGRPHRGNRPYEGPCTTFLREHGRAQSHDADDQLTKAKSPAFPPGFPLDLKDQIRSYAGCERRRRAHRTCRRSCPRSSSGPESRSPSSGTRQRPRSRDPACR